MAVTCVFTRDPKRTAATIDRLVHHAHVIPLDGDSYRTRAHRTGPPPANISK